MFYGQITYGNIFAIVLIMGITAIVLLGTLTLAITILMRKK